MATNNKWMLYPCVYNKTHLNCLELKLYFLRKYEVHSTIISLGYQVSDFAGNSRAQKLNKEQKKRENIIGVHHYL